MEPKTKFRIDCLSLLLMLQPVILKKGSRNWIVTVHIFYFMYSIPQLKSQIAKELLIKPTQIFLTTMAKARLDGLAKISLEHEVCQKLDYGGHISDFVKLSSKKKKPVKQCYL